MYTDIYLQIKRRGNQPLYLLGDVCLWLDYKCRFCESKQTKKSVQQWSEYGSTVDERRQPKKTLLDLSYL